MHLTTITLAKAIISLTITGGIPQVHIDTQGAINQTDKVHASLQVTSDDTYFDGYCGIKVRGTSSAGYEKKSYTVEIWDAAGNDAKPDQPLLGMPPEEDYVLHGPYHDDSGFRNYFTYTLARSLGRWAPRARFCQVHLNGEDRGLYVFVEKIKRDGDRIDIAKENPDNPNHGYIYKKDKHDPDEYTLNTQHNGSFVVKYPKVLSEAQDTYLKGLIDGTLKSIENGGDPWFGYPAHIDVNSWYDEWILQQLASNPDSFGSSSYFYRDKSGPLVAGPVWDLNLGFGDGAMSNNGISGWENSQQPWWKALMEDPSFVIGLVQRWTELRQNALSTTTMISIIDDARDEIEAVAIADKLMGGGDEWNEIVDHMCDWIADRAAWIDDNIAEFMIPCVADCSQKTCGWDGCGGSCGSCATSLVCFAGACEEPCVEPGCPIPPLHVYTDEFADGFTPKLHSDVDDSVTDAPGGVDGMAISMGCESYTDLHIKRERSLPSLYSAFSLRVNGGEGSGQELKVQIGSEQHVLSEHLVPGQWVALDLTFPDDQRDIYLRCGGGNDAPVFIDDIRFTGTLEDCDCDDSQDCTIDLCTNGNCSHSQKDCDDGIDCTVDSCVEGMGCIFDDALCHGDSAGTPTDPNDNIPSSSAPPDVSGDAWPSMPANGPENATGFLGVEGCSGGAHTTFPGTPMALWGLLALCMLMHRVRKRASPLD